MSIWRSLSDGPPERNARLLAVRTKEGAVHHCNHYAKAGEGYEGMAFWSFSSAFVPERWASHYLLIDDLPKP